ncbi:MAG: hypothetical protein IJ617_03595, partial [Oscillospiraceae bacterium]|nr:hypothetical protein [Oscillospiraceae bacterium]
MVWRRISGLVLGILILCSMALPALADGGAADGEMPPREVPADDPRFLNRSWEEIVEEFLTKKSARREYIGLAYYNTVTGETHFYNGGEYFYAASLYKLPLNMYYGEQVYRGEMTMDDIITSGLRYGDMQRSSLQFSANWTSEQLQGYLGSDDDYIDAILPYIVPEGEDYDRAALRRNSFTPEQMLRALQLLYDAPERYPEVLYYLKEAMPDNFFRLWERRFPIAQKYGWLSTDGVDICNDAGIVWTDEPILLVFMSQYLPGSTVAIGDFCVLMSDYSQYWHGIHLAENAEAALLAGERGRAVGAAAETAAA